MELVTSHHVEGANTNLTVKAVGKPILGPGFSHYQITGFDMGINPANVDCEGYSNNYSMLPIVFHNGPVNPESLAGVTLESLLAVCLHRLEGFQGSINPCYENAEAIAGINRALTALKSRTTRILAIAAMHKQIEEGTFSLS